MKALAAKFFAFPGYRLKTIALLAVALSLLWLNLAGGLGELWNLRHERIAIAEYWSLILLAIVVVHSLCAYEALTNRYFGVLRDYVGARLKRFIVLAVALAAAALGLARLREDHPHAFAASTLALVLTLTAPLALAILPTWGSIAHEHIRESAWFRRLFLLGRRGASARWAGVASLARLDFDAPMRGHRDAWRAMKAPIYLGMSESCDDPRFGGRHIGLDGHSHQLVIAKTGAGKSRDVLYHTVLRHPHGMFVMAPKGELLRCSHVRRGTEERRRLYQQRGLTRVEECLGQPVYILDPFGLSTDFVLPQDRHRFNPLTELDPDSPTFWEDSRAISDACILDSNNVGNSQHFNETAQTLIRGGVLHALTRLPPEQQTLQSVFNLFVRGHARGVAVDPRLFERFLDELSINERGGAVAMEAARYLRSAGPNERGSMLTTLVRALGWVNSPSIADNMSRSDFSLRAIPDSNATLFYTLPVDKLETHQRYSRLLTNMLLQACQRRSDGDHPRVLMLLDEYAQLGRMRMIENALLHTRSKGLLIMPVLQNLQQLYDRTSNANDILSSANKQFFGVNDLVTARYISEALGERMVNGQLRPLLTPAEVREYLDESSDRQIVLPASGLPLRLRRVPFYRATPTRLYDDPWR